MKHRIGSAALALTLATSLTTAAFAARGEGQPLISPKPSYANTLILNGDKLDTSAIPAMEDKNLVPMRLVAEGDFGAAQWYEEDGMSGFYLGGNALEVVLSTGAITLNDEAVNTVAVLYDGVTFVPVDVLSLMEGYTVNVKNGTIEITTPNNQPVIKSGYAVAEAAKMSQGMITSEQELTDFYQIPAGQFESVFAMFPMMTTPDTLVMGKLAENADVDAIKAALETYRAGQEETFSWYLSDNLPKVKNAQVLVEDGYFLFLIGEDAEAGVKTFREFVAAETTQPDTQPEPTPTSLG